MSDGNITTTVQSGETLVLYARMYGCSVDEIKDANKMKDGKLSTGQKINIPIGKKWELPSSNDNVLDKKISYFNNKINDVHMQLYNPDLKPEERENLEQQYIELMNKKKERDATADITKAGNGINLVLTMKKDITVSEFRDLFPECSKKFYDYACDTDQREFIQGVGWRANPDYVTLHEGDKIMLKAHEYAHEGFWNEVANGIKKQFGRLDK